MDCWSDAKACSHRDLSAADLLAACSYASFKRWMVAWFEMFNGGMVNHEELSNTQDVESETNLRLSERPLTSTAEPAESC